MPDAAHLVGRVVRLTTDTTEQLLVAADPRRVALVIATDTTDAGGIIRASGIIGGTLTLITRTGESHIDFYWGRHGPLVGARWTIQVAGAPIGISCYELVDTR